MAVQQRPWMDRMSQEGRDADATKAGALKDPLHSEVYASKLDGL
jgi:hypothetical protein